MDSYGGGLSSYRETEANQTSTQHFASQDPTKKGGSECGAAPSTTRNDTQHSVKQKQPKSQKRRNIEPILDRRRNQSKSNLRTSNSRNREEQFLNADVFSYRGVAKQRKVGHGRNQSQNNAQSQKQLLGVKQFAPQTVEAVQSGDQQPEWSTGIHKLMSKVQTMKQDGGGQIRSKVYTEHPDFRKSNSVANSRNFSATGGPIIRKGRMQFGKTTDGFSEQRPEVDRYVISPYMGQKRQIAPFQVFYPEQKTRLQLTQATGAAHMIETAEQVNLQGETSMQFEYLVNKTFLNSENKDLEKQASRISKLNALCQKVNEDVHQLKNEIEQGYDIDPVGFANKTGKQQQQNLRKSYGGGPGQPHPVQNTENIKADQMQTPLEAVTQGINLMYATGRVKNERNQMLNAKSGQIKVPESGQILSSLPNIVDPELILKQEEQLFKDYTWQQKQNQSGPYRRLKSGGSPPSRSNETSPTTISKSYLTRGPSQGGYPQQQNMAVNRKRVQSAVNKKSRQIAANHGLPIDMNQALLKEYNSHQKNYQEEDREQKKARRTKSAIFRPLSDVQSMNNRLGNNQSTQQLTNIRSSHPLFGLKPESSQNAGTGPQLSPEQMVQILSSQIERQLAEKPNALQSESDRKNLIDKAIRQLFVNPQEEIIQSPSCDKLTKQPSPQVTKLDNLIHKQKQTTLESIQENQTQFVKNNGNSEENDSKALQQQQQQDKSNENNVGNLIPVKQFESQESILTDQMSLKEVKTVKKINQQAKQQSNDIVHAMTVKQVASQDRRSSYAIQVQVTDIEAADITSPLPQLGRFKSSYTTQVKGHKRLLTNTKLAEKAEELDKVSEIAVNPLDQEVAGKIPVKKLLDSTKSQIEDGTHSKLVSMHQSDDYRRLVSHDIVQSANMEEVYDFTQNLPDLQLNKAQTTMNFVGNFNRPESQVKKIANSSEMMTGVERTHTMKPESIKQRSEIVKPMIKISKKPVTEVNSVSQPTPQAPQSPVSEVVSPPTNQQAIGHNQQQNQDLQMLDADVMANQNMMFGCNSYYDDDDYAYQKEHKIKMQNRKMTALSYDTAVRTSKVAGNSQLQPILREQNRQNVTSSLTRAAKLQLQSSAKADLRLTELYRSTIEEFKRKLTVQKQENMLARVNQQQLKNTSKSPTKLDQVKKSEEKKTKKHQKSPPKRSHSKGKISPRNLKHKKHDEGGAKSKRLVPGSGGLKKKKRTSQHQVGSMDDHSNDSKVSHRSKTGKSDKGSLHIQSRTESQLSKDVGNAQQPALKDSKTTVNEVAGVASSSNERPAGLDKLKPIQQQDTAENEKGKQQLAMKKTASQVSIGKHSNRSENESKSPFPGDHKKKKGLSRRTSVVRTGSSSAAQQLKRKLSSFTNIGGVAAMASNAVSAVQEVTSDGNRETSNNVPINIRIARAGNKKANTSKKLMDIIKGYEDEKMKSHLSRDELDLLALIEEFKIPVEEPKPQGFGMDMIKKFMPGNLASLVPGGALGGINPLQAIMPAATTSVVAPQVTTAQATTFSEGNTALGTTTGGAGAEKSGEETKIQKLLGGRLQLGGLGGVAATVQPLASPAQVFKPPEKTFKYQTKRPQQQVHQIANVSTKQKFFFDELDIWKEKTQDIAIDTQKYLRDSMGEFEFLDESIQITTMVPPDENCFLSHPNLKDVYELNHGFLINNSFQHGNKMKLDHGSIKEAQKLNNDLQTSDPRHTKSASSLILPICFQDGDQDDKVQKQNKQHGQIKMDSSWFDEAEEGRLLFSSPGTNKDDLDRDTEWKNLVVENLDQVKDVAFKPDRDQQEFQKKMLSTSQGEIANIHRAECDFLVNEGIREAKFESVLDQEFGNDIIPQIELIGQVPRSRLITTQDVEALEMMYAQQDDQCPMISSLIEHPENLQYIQFDQVDENLPKDVSVDIIRFGLTKTPLKLSLTQVIEKEIEAPIQLLWLLRIDELLYDAISNLLYSPFKPAPIMENFQMEFNVMQIDSYRDYLETFITDLPVKTTHNFEYCTSRLMKGMMDFFHNQVVRRYDHQAHLAIRFSRPLMRRAHRENLLKEGKFFTPVRNITSDKDLQLFKRHAGMPERIEAKRSNSMQLYTSFDTGCVRHHFYNSAANLPDYKNQMDKILSYTIRNAKDQDQSIETIESLDEDDISDPEQQPESATSHTTSKSRLRRLQKSPTKAQMIAKQKEANHFQKSVIREEAPIKVRFNNSQIYNADNQAVIVVQQDDLVPSLHRAPILLHEQFMHIWGYKVRIFPEPRAGLIAVNHQVIPEGQSKDDFVNQDFCFYDTVEIVATPEATRTRQAQLREVCEQRILQFQQSAQSVNDSSKNFTLEILRNSQSPKKRGLSINVSDLLDKKISQESESQMTYFLDGQGIEEGQKQIQDEQEQLKVSLTKPAMRKSKSKNSGDPSPNSRGKSHLKSKSKKKKTSASPSVPHSAASFQSMHNSSTEDLQARTGSIQKKHKVYSKKGSGNVIITSKATKA